MTVLDTLQDSIARATPSAFGDNKRAVLFGTTDSADAARQICCFVEQALGSPIEELLFLGMSSAFAAGLTLADGRKLFLKVHAGELDIAQLRRVHDLQDHLREGGLPAASLVLAATEFGNARYASVHAFRDRGERLRAYHRGTIPAAASALARLVGLGRAVAAQNDVPEVFGVRKNPLVTRAPGMPEPPPLPPAEHASAVVERVKEAARAMPGETVICHADWASRNMRFEAGEVSSIFDFEALRLGIEPVLVGQAAIQFINEPSGVREPPVATAYFIDAYERAAGRVFEGEQLVALDTGVALAVSTFCRAMVKSDGMRDEDAPKIVENFMARFRHALGREYAKNPFI
jgi:Ser/Thr protein kinase RdoA (MazF antagonist)